MNNNYFKKLEINVNDKGKPELYVDGNEIDLNDVTDININLLSSGIVIETKTVKAFGYSMLK